DCRHYSTAVHSSAFSGFYSVRGFSTCKPGQKEAACRLAKRRKDHENETFSKVFRIGSALSSAVEHFLHTEGVAGSKPAARTIFPKENGESVVSTKDLPNISQVFDDEIEKPVNFPKRLRYRKRGRVLATIYIRVHGPIPRLSHCRPRSFAESL